MLLMDLNMVLVNLCYAVNHLIMRSGVSLNIIHQVFIQETNSNHMLEIGKVRNLFPLTL